ncbi:MAG: endolytic transglycosylase MltG [Nocardioidaceae bacterium]
MTDEHEYHESGHDESGHEPVFAGAGSRRGERKRGAFGCLAMLLVAALVIGGGALLVVAGIGKAKDMFGGPSDYSGTGSGTVTVEVKKGDTAAAIGRTLKAAGVVKSVDAFVSAANADERARGIQVGFYELKKEMSAKAALDILIDPDNLVRAEVTIPEGLTVEQAVTILAKKTDFTAKQYQKVLAQPAKLGLPAYAEGDPEGFLFPATYQVPPNATPASVLKAMVTRFKTAAGDLSLAKGAKAQGRTPHDIVTIASIIEREVNRKQDLAGVAEVIDNRLAGRCPETAGLLQMDSTVHFAAGANDSVFTTDEMRATDSPYNTYKYPGLPPGPISSPGQAALDAALHPSDNGYCYFVAVNLETGETLFAKTVAEHAANKAKLDEYCATSDLC